MALSGFERRTTTDEANLKIRYISEFSVLLMDIKCSDLKRATLSSAIANGKKAGAFCCYTKKEGKTEMGIAEYAVHENYKHFPLNLR